MIQEPTYLCDPKGTEDRCNQKSDRRRENGMDRGAVSIWYRSDTDGGNRLSSLPMRQKESVNTVLEDLSSQTDFGTNPVGILDRPCST